MITINVEVEDTEKFIYELKDFVKEFCPNNPECLKVDNLTIDEYIKHFIQESE